MAHNAVIVFCKPPVAGRVKTRLIGALSARQAAEVHAACVRDTVAMVRAVPCAQKWLYVAADRATARGLGMRLRLGKNWKVVTQRGDDLGERMRNAMDEQLRAGAEKVVIAGTDSPWMGRARIERALQLLDKTEVVLGPSEDGGYYLIATRRMVSKLFSEIHWGTAEVLPQTLRALRATRTSFRLLQRDFDLDRPEDLRRVARMAVRGTLHAPALTRWVRESTRRRGRGLPHKTRRPARA
ncbi:MAG: TIGR04282 family arsenosugar biosynthesis glycosyltransferase [Acidobacteria bacterium]|nr:TIGR04282 family arsenosugar biosynthesis glycosyltransferase [Acidobacteriota bacterium]